MPRPRIKILLAGQGAAITTIKAALEVELGRRASFDRPTNWSERTLNGALNTVLQVRFETQAGADFVWARLTALSSVAGVSARMSYHQCSHDDPVTHSCSSVARSGYVEASL